MQTDYGNMRAGVVGQISHMVPSTLISRTLESASVGFGLAVSQGSDDGGVVTYAGDFVGVVVRERSLPAEQDNILQEQSASLMTEGAIFVSSAAAVVAGDIVHILAGGTFGKTGGTLLPGARWDTSTTGADQLAVIRLG